MKTLKLSTLLFCILALFSCSKEADIISSFDQPEAEIDVRRKGKNCNPNINFPLPFSSIANSGQQIEPDDCDSGNYTSFGTSPLEAYYDCRFDNPLEPTPPVTCESFVVPLYDYCDQQESQFHLVKLFPTANPVSSDPFYIEAQGADFGSSSVFTNTHFNLMTTYANNVIANTTAGLSFDYIEVDFFTTPESCILSCPCSTSWDSDVGEILLHPTNVTTLYIVITLCKLKDQPQLGDIDPM